VTKVAKNGHKLSQETATNVAENGNKVAVTGNICCRKRRLLLPERVTFCLRFRQQLWQVLLNI